MTFKKFFNEVFKLWGLTECIQCFLILNTICTRILISRRFLSLNSIRIRILLLGNRGFLSCLIIIGRIKILLWEKILMKIRCIIY